MRPAILAAAALAVACSSIACGSDDSSTGPAPDQQNVKLVLSALPVVSSGNTVWLLRRAPGGSFEAAGSMPATPFSEFDLGLPQSDYEAVVYVPDDAGWSGGVLTAGYTAERSGVTPDDKWLSVSYYNRFEGSGDPVIGGLTNDGAPATLTGTLRDSNGNPSSVGQVWIGDRIWTTPDSAGAFTLEVAPGAHLVHAVGPGTGEITWTTSAGPGAIEELGDGEAGPAKPPYQGKVGCQVVDSRTGEPIVGASITTSAGTVATAGADGRFEVDALFEHQGLAIRAEHYASEWPMLIPNATSGTCTMWPLFRSLYGVWNYCYSGNPNVADDRVVVNDYVTGGPRLPIEFRSDAMGRLSAYSQRAGGEFTLFDYTSYGDADWSSVASQRNHMWAVASGRFQLKDGMLLNISEFPGPNGLTADFYAPEGTECPAAATQPPPAADACLGWCSFVVGCGGAQGSVDECVQSCAAGLPSASAECKQALDAVTTCIAPGCDAAQACANEINNVGMLCGGQP